MKEQLISFETAKLAKEKGFDWSNTIHGYIGGTLTEYWFLRLSINDRKKDETDINHVIGASTQSLLQKWLREKHNIKIIVDSSTKNQFGDWVQWYVNVNNKSIIDHRDGLDTYEEALEAGLIEAFKLI